MKLLLRVLEGLLVFILTLLAGQVLTSLIHSLLVVDLGACWYEIQWGLWCLWWFSLTMSILSLVVGVLLAVYIRRFSKPTRVGIMLVLLSLSIYCIYWWIKFS